LCNDIRSLCKEVEMVAQARKLGLLTTPYAFTPEEAAAMAGAGADIVVAHVGLTTVGLCPSWPHPAIISS
jgi:predicted TIM-barrel enzyme